MEEGRPKLRSGDRPRRDLDELVEVNSGEKREFYSREGKRVVILVCSW